DEKIKVDITLKESKVFKEIPIEIKGEGDQKVVFKHPEDGTISVTAIGLDTLMEELEESEIIALIDVTNTLSDKESRDNITIEGIVLQLMDWIPLWKNWKNQKLSHRLMLQILTVIKNLE